LDLATEDWTIAIGFNPSRASRALQQIRKDSMIRRRIDGWEGDFGKRYVVWLSADERKRLEVLPN